MTDLVDLIKSGEVTFYNRQDKLNIPVDGDDYSGDIANYLFNKNIDYLTICGLASFLSNPEKVYDITELIANIWFKTKSKTKIHIDVDIEKLNQNYPKINGFIGNLAGENIIETANWLPNILDFKKCWNFSLCRSIGDMVGYPGYEHPRTEAGFEAENAYFASFVIIGTKEQIKRYEAYANKFSNVKTEILDILKEFG